MAYDALATKSLTCNVDPACRAARDGIKRIYEAERDQLLPGMRQAAAAARQIANGSVSLNNGLARLEAGLDEARDGAAQIHDGHETLASEVDELEEGVEKLNEGTDELTDGTEQIADGTQEAQDAIEELEDGLEEASDYLLELGDEARDPSIGGFYLPEDAFEEDDLVSAIDLFLSDDSSTARLFVLDKIDAQERPAALRIAEVQEATDRALAGTALAGADVNITGSAPFNVNLHHLSQAEYWLVATVAQDADLIILNVKIRTLVAP
jgi:RND superfamily putative drug exporter